MEAPEKIYLTEDNPSKEWYRTKQVGFDSIEYTRTDVFIEKACKGIEHLLSGYIIRNFNFGDSYDMDKFTEDFINYI